MEKGEINLTIEHETGHCSVYRMAKREVLNAGFWPLENGAL